MVPEEAGSHPSASPLLQQPHLVELLCSLRPAASFMSADASDVYLVIYVPLPCTSELLHIVLQTAG